MQVTETIERLSQIVGENQKKFAQEVGIFESDLSNILKGKRGISKNLLTKLIEKNFSADWILTGRGAMTISDKPLKSGQENLITSWSDPYFSAGSGGGILDVPENAEIMSISLALKDQIGSLKDVVMVCCRGDSMEPDIPENSHVFFRNDGNYADGMICALRHNYNFFIKRIEIHSNNIRLLSSNKSYDPKPVKKGDDIKIFGRVLSTLKTL